MTGTIAETVISKTLPTAGEEWLEGYLCPEKFGEFGRLVANILNVVYVGIYHISDEVLYRKAEWYEKEHISIFISDELATFDYARLTLLVLLCHKYSVRFRVRAVTGKRSHECTPGHSYEVPLLELLFSERVPSSDAVLSRYHPNLTEAIEGLESTFGIELRS